jgi:hypothetical protein
MATEVKVLACVQAGISGFPKLRPVDKHFETRSAGNCVNHFYRSRRKSR